MSERDSGSLSRANGAWLVVDHFWKRLEINGEEEDATRHTRDTRPRELRGKHEARSSQFDSGHCIVLQGILEIKDTHRPRTIR